MKKILFFLACTSLAACQNIAHDTSKQKMVKIEKPNYPQTKTVDQVDDYFGTKIADPYRWLENDTAADTEAWVKEENAITEKFLSQIPFRNKIKKRLEKIWDYPKFGAPEQVEDWYIFSKNNGLQNQSVLYAQKGIDASPELLLDPNTLSTDGTVALQNYKLSKTLKYFAYTVSASGSDWQEIYVMDFHSKQLVADKLEYVKFTEIAWNGDDGFYYSGYDRPKDEKTKFSAKTEFQKIFYHKIGTSQSEDKIVYEDKAHPLRYVGASLTEDEKYLVLSISEGTDGSEIKIKDLTKPNSSFVTVVNGFETNSSVIESNGKELLILTNQSAPNYKVVAIEPGKPFAQAKIIVPEKSEVLQSAATGGGKLFCSYLKNACTEVSQFDLDGKNEVKIELPGLGTASGFHSKANQNSFYYTFTSFTYPSTIFKYDISSGKSSLYKKAEVKFNPADFVTEQVFYTSKDGTKVPMFITYKKGMKLNGNNPTLLYGYGGFNISITPSFSISNIVFLENGGVYCVANIRGGAEMGEAWHKGGMLANKQNVFDDFIAAAEYLIKEKYTSNKKLAIMGRSNGGLLVGACMTQRPDLFAVAFPGVGVLDMLRYHKFTVGWGWAVEYGSSDNKEQFDYLIKYSPLHNIKKGICYPATMITTADHDDRVVPAHSFKFAATLQATQGCDKPALIRIDSKAGHGAGKPTAKQIEEQADIWSFLFYNVGVSI